MRRRPKGIALMMALVCLLIIGLVTSGLVHLSLAETRRARSDASTVQAQAAADAGALAVVRDWQSLQPETLSVGAALPVLSTQWDSATARTRVSRISPLLWHVESLGESGDSALHSLARRKISALFTLSLPDLSLDAALTIRDSLALSGSAVISGVDSIPPQWSGGCTSTGSGAAVATPDSTRICEGSCATHTGPRLVGSPQVLQDSLVGAMARFQQFGAESWGSLTANAAIVLAPNSVITPLPQITGGTCDRTASSNWGDPTGASSCASYAPVIWARGDVEVRGGHGQGVLLVDGDLTLSQGARIDGLVIVQDDLISGPGGGQVTGSVMAADFRILGPGDHSLLADDLTITLSRCTAQGVLLRSARLEPVSRRWWVPIP